MRVGFTIHPPQRGAGTALKRITIIANENLNIPGSVIFDQPLANWIGSFPYWVVSWLEIQAQYYQWTQLAQIDRRDTGTDPQISVGSPDVQSGPAQSGNELSHLVIAESPTEISGTAIEGSEMYDSYPTNWIDYWDWKNAGGNPAPPGTAAPAANLNTGGDNVSVFDDLGDVFVEWVNTQVNPPPPGSPTYQNDPGTVGPPQPVPTGGPGLPPANMGGQIVCAPEGPSPVWKKVCGVYKWVIPKRRRRRALLTEGDYNSLLRIEGLKVNKNMTAAIAKALTRG